MTRSSLRTARTQWLTISPTARRQHVRDLRAIAKLIDTWPGFGAVVASNRAAADLLEAIGAEPRKRAASKKRST